MAKDSSRRTILIWGRIGIDMGTLKLVLIAICQHADNETNTCFPSVRRLAQMTHLGKSTCAKAIGYLNCAGCFDVYSRGAGHGSSFYRIDLERLKDWEINFSVHETDTTDESDVHAVDSEMLGDSPSVHPVDVASTTGTQCPRGSTQSPPAEPNLSFDRSVVPSEKSVRVAPPPAKVQTPNQSKSKPDGSLVASATPTAIPKPICFHCQKDFRFHPENLMDGYCMECLSIPYVKDEAVRRKRELEAKPKRRFTTFDDYDDDGNLKEEARAAVAGSIDSLMDELR